MRNCFLIYLLLIFSSDVLGQSQTNLDYLSILRRAEKYDTCGVKDFPKFTYQSSNSKDLVSLRKKYNLDSVAGFGNEASRLLNLLHWVHNTVKHDGQHESGIKRINADEILTSAIKNKTAVCCGELASTLNDCYLAMGWASRKIYCFPKDSLGDDGDSHVINMVYLSSKHKWIWVDPTNDAYVMDEKGELLSIEEVRQRLIQNKPLIVNPDANWNHKSSTVKEYYLDFYMAKNLYRFYCPLNSEYDYETKDINKNVIYVYLFPLDYHIRKPYMTKDYNNSRLKTSYNIYNEKLFWANPND